MAGIVSFYFVLTNLCFDLNDKNNFNFYSGKSLITWNSVTNEQDTLTNAEKAFDVFHLASNKKSQEQHDDPELLNALFERTTMITLRPVPAIIFKRQYKI